MNKKKSHSTITSRVSRLFGKVLPLGALQRHATRKTIEEFAETLGLVYFGYVDQHADEHELVRGFTLSKNHKDNHYCVGSAYNYDVILVERTDVLRSPKGQSHIYHWTILQIDLHTNDFPHAFITASRHPEAFYSTFFMKFARFQKLPQSIWRDHDEAFAKSFAAFAAPESAEQLVRLFSPDATASIGQYFEGIEFELTNDKLYLYMGNQSITPNLLDRLFKNGLWLAGQLDSIQKHANKYDPL